MARTRTRRPSARPDGIAQARVGMSKTVAQILDDRALTQTEAARIMRDAPSQVSLVTTGKLTGFSTERMLRMIARLGRDIEIVVRPSRSSSGRVRYTVMN